MTKHKPSHRPANRPANRPQSDTDNTDDTAVEREEDQADVGDDPGPVPGVDPTTLKGDRAAMDVGQGDSVFTGDERGIVEELRGLANSVRGSKGEISLGTKVRGFLNEKGALPDVERETPNGGCVVKSEFLVNAVDGLVRSIQKEHKSGDKPQRSRK